MATIDLSNYATTLKQSSTARTDTGPNTAVKGNIFFDVTNGRLEIITKEEKDQLDLTGLGVGAADVVATSLVNTTKYIITAAGTTDFTLIGAADSNPGTEFTASGAGTGTGTASETTDNPLTEDDGIKLEALYAFERQERRIDETLRQYDFYFTGTFKFGGAYEIVNNRKFDDADGGNFSLTVDDRFKVRGSGWIERDVSGSIGRIYYGNKSLGNIETLSQPYYQLADGGAPINYDKDGPIDEAVQVYGDNDVDTNAYTTAAATAAAQTITVVASARTLTRSTGDYVADGFIVGHRFGATGLANNTGTYTVESVTALVITTTLDASNLLTDETGDADEELTVTGIDTRSYESLKVRTFGQNYDEKILSDSGVAEMGGYSSGFALGESVHLTSGSYTLADVYTAQISPWTGMGLEELDTPQTETGFTTADGDFTWVLNNTVPGDLNQCIAFLDALAQTDDDVNDHGSNVTNGKRVGVWYTYNAAGKILPQVGTGAAGEGLFIEQLAGTDKNRVIFTDDAGDTKEYPAFSNVSVTVGANAVDDANAWFHAFFLDGPGAGDDFNTSGALTVEDADGATLIKGNVNGSGLRTVNDINFEFDHAGDTIGGPGGTGTDKDVVFECEGDGGVTQAKTVFTLTSAATITASCVPLVENNV